jgi:hypothetical protein
MTALEFMQRLAALAPRPRMFVDPVPQPAARNDVNFESGNSMTLLAAVG